MRNKNSSTDTRGLKYIAIPCLVASLILTCVCCKEKKYGDSVKKEKVESFVGISTADVNYTDR